MGSRTSTDAEQQEAAPQSATVQLRSSNAAASRGLEQLTQQATQHSDSLLKIMAAIADAVTSEEVFEAVVDRVAEAVGASSVALWLVEKDSVRARLMRAFGYSDSAQASLEYLALDAETATPAVDSIRQAEPIWIPSRDALLQSYPHLAALANHRAYRVACLPLVTRGRVLGTLGMTTEQEGEISSEEQSFLLLVARYAGQAIERLRLLEDEKLSLAMASAAARRLGVLNHAAQVFTDPSLDLQARLQSIVVEIGQALSSTTGITLLQADGLLYTNAVHHPVAQAQQRLMDLGQASPIRPGDPGIVGHVSVSGKSVLIGQVDAAVLRARAAPAYREFLDSFPSYGFMCVPLRARGHTFGTVTASRLTPEAFSTDDLRLMEELAERAAVSLENSRLYSESRTAQRRAEQLYRFAQAVAAADKLEFVYDAAISAIEATLRATRSAILILDDAGVMRFRAWRKLSDHYRAMVEGHSPWSADTKNPAPVLVPDPQLASTLTHLLPLFEREGIGALAFIPLVLDGRLLGKFMVYYDAPHCFLPEEVDTALTIANHLSPVIARFSAVAKLEETIRSNELFTGVLAHDLRNPLSAIMTAAQYLLMRREGEAPLNAESKPLSKILSSGQRMALMIEQLLDFARARSGGGIPVEPQYVNLQELCAQAAEELELAHPMWSIKTLTDGDLRGSWDPTRLLQVVSNLIANAGHHGRPNTQITVTLNGTEQAEVSISVHNLGCISEELIPRLFDPFRTVRQHNNPRRGVGLGLYIVQELVRAHAGTVQVSSNEERGTTFSVQLPRHLPT